MKQAKRPGRALIIVICVIAVISSSVLALAATGIWQPFSWLGGDSTPEYEKPDLNNVAQEGIAPDPMTPAEDAISTDKPWYEFITYSAKEIHSYIVKGNKKNSDVKYVFYDPYDYNFGLTMEIDDTNVFDSSVPGKDLVMPCPFSSANQVDVSWSSSRGREYNEEISVGVEASFGTEYSALGLTVKTEIQGQFGFTFTATQSSEWGMEMSQSFSAVHFNSNGVPYQWKVVHYTVYMPLKVEVYKQNKKGEFVLESTTYCAIPTVEGTCREYIVNGVVYIEDWRTGEGIPLDEFWEDFMTESDLKKAYEGKLLPTT